jgi:hypothetical protein
MKKMMFLAVASMIVCSCSENTRVRNFGGSMDITLPKGQKLVSITWKEDQIWYLTRPMGPGEVPVVSTFQEKSPKGLVEGRIIIHESN